MADSFIKWFIQSLTEVTIGVFILIFIITSVYRKVNNKDIDPFLIIGGTISAALAPSGLALLIFAMKPDMFSNLEKFRLFLAVAGIVLICISIGAVDRILNYEK